ncbi:uncharacterized protein LOC124647195 [Lolium rigidum]|uniref:uncharacterized protein LOC124647195 n=1 Tax=Lolium rigidum TaxID=89674 RepID=UPI001F5C243F|nr:uncharacterized protein LOC124647195 [Lolium rigidum]
MAAPGSRAAEHNQKRRPLSADLLQNCDLLPPAKLFGPPEPPRIATSLARHGCRLVLVGDEGALAATAEEARRCAGGGAAAVAVVGLDFEACDETAAGAAVEAAWRCFGDGLDALVNCCSYEGEVQDCLSITEDEYEKTMKINVTTPWFLIKAIAKRFRDAQSAGSIVCLTQIIGAERGLYPGAAAYGIRRAPATAAWPRCSCATQQRYPRTDGGS